MGANAYLAAVASYGREANTAATVLTMFVDPKPGKRTAILGVAFSPSEKVEDLYIMQALGYTYASAVAASGATNVHLTAQPGHAAESYGRPTNALAAADWLAVELTNGKYHYSPITTWTVASLVASLTLALSGSVASGAPIYNFGIYSDQGHFKVKCPAAASAAQVTDQGDPFIFASNIRGAPLIVYMQSASTTKCSVDYVMAGYFTV